MSALKIPRHVADVMAEVLNAIRNGDTIEIVEDIWISGKEAGEILGRAAGKKGPMRNEHLGWLCDKDFLERRKVDQKSFEYNPVKVEHAKKLLEHGKIKLPTINSFYKKDAA